MNDLTFISALSHAVLSNLRWPEKRLFNASLKFRYFSKKFVLRKTGAAPPTCGLITKSAYGFEQ